MGCQGSQPTTLSKKRYSVSGKVNNSAKSSREEGKKSVKEITNNSENSSKINFGASRKVKFEKDEDSIRNCNERENLSRNLKDRKPTSFPKFHPADFDSDFSSLEKNSSYTESEESSVYE
mmetsp:Transcript_19418/g.21719  ORF Transcript_19418/g.21719 Transcript_19418/m.21719 type:complete len:120 (-) Transcript_19418:80-439(-)